MVPAIIRSDSLIPSFSWPLMSMVYQEKFLLQKRLLVFSCVPFYALLWELAFFINFLPPAIAGLDFYVCCLVSGIFSWCLRYPGMRLFAIVIPGRVRSRFFIISVLAAQVLVGQSDACSWVICRSYFPFNFGVNFLMEPLLLVFRFLCSIEQSNLKCLMNPNPQPISKENKST